MTRRSRKARRAAAGKARRPRVWWLGGIVIAGAILTIAVWSLRGRSHRDTLTPLQMSDSLSAATSAFDTERAMLWASRLALEMPRHFAVVGNLGVAYHNYATYQRMRYVRPRSALRLSLERIRLERRALALVDSSAGLAGTDTDWMRAREWRARLLDYLGLPIEALAAYEEPAGRGLRYPHMEKRAAAIRARLMNPLVADDTTGAEAPTDSSP